MTGNLTPPRAPSLFGGVWLISFADLISLLVSFFIMLYAMSDVQPEAWNAFRAGLAHGLGRGDDERSQPATPARTRSTDSVGADLDYLAVLLGERLTAGGAGATIARRDDRLVIALDGTDLFASGQMTLTESGEARIERVAAVLGHLRNRVEVKAAGGESPVLGVGRALAVAAALRRSGYAHDIPALALFNEPASAGDRIDIHVLGVAP